jgi:energy-coupling factor transporter ATP-binding protein EcfA2
MRLKSVTVENVGGLVDQRVELPEQAFVAFAGPNGTGKSKLLASLIGFWINNIPSPRTGLEARVAVEVVLSDDEREALADLTTKLLRGTARPTIPKQVTLIAMRSAIGGNQRTSDQPGLPVLHMFSDNAEFLQQNPTLNPMYLPAERRLIPSGSTAIDLTQLAESQAFAQSQQSRAAVQNYGRLDDQEFEQFAKALCVASALPDDPKEPIETPLSRMQWAEFELTINELLHPKKLLPLTRAFPDQLRIKLPNDDTHPVPDLSSGERQALVIISRVLRAGVGQKVVIIDEPDAYLHPNLSQRLIAALQRGIEDSGQFIVATHSPAILDRVAPSSILRLGYETAASVLADESELIELYRTTGFRASALTQSELLVVTEGDLDDVVLKALFPKLARASIQQGHGRVGVLQRVRHLIDYKVPVLGMVDRDVDAPHIDSALQPHIYVLPTADLEGAFLSDDVALEVMVDRGLAKSTHSSLTALKTERDLLYGAQRDKTIAELAQSELRKKFGIQWPKPKGDNPLDRLRDIASQSSNPSATEIDVEINAATVRWDAAQDEPWTIVRGKYILNEFTTRCTDWKKGSSLLASIAMHQPSLSALADIEVAINRRLA